MSNVLPQSVTTQHTRVLRLRVFFVIATCLYGASAIMVIAVLPSYMQTRAETSAIELSMTKTSTTTVQEARTILSNAKRRADALHAIVGMQMVQKAVSEALGEAPEGISITTIRYEYGSKGGALTLSGTAPDRQDVLAYVQRLKLVGRFSDVSVPVSSLTSRDTGKFDILMSGAF